VRHKDRKEHRSWSVVESQRLSRQRVVQRHVRHLGELNVSQRAAWEKPLAVFDEQHDAPLTCALFPDDRTPSARALSDNFSRRMNCVMWDGHVESFNYHSGPGPQAIVNTTANERLQPGWRFYIRP
jgi:prepilin-type processing-associated H-X9-DG protein